MTRDMDLIRIILLKIEKSSEEELEDFILNDYDTENIKFHLNILLQNNMIDKYFEDVLGGIVVGHLTWEGCDYLEKIRDNTIWRKTKETITKAALLFVFDTVKNVATSFISSAAEGAVNAIIKNGGAL